MLHLLTTFSLALTGLNVLEMLNFMRKWLNTWISEPHPFYIVNLWLTVELFTNLKFDLSCSKNFRLLNFMRILFQLFWQGGVVFIREVIFYSQFSIIPYGNSHCVEFLKWKKKLIFFTIILPIFFPNKIQLNSPVKCPNRGDPLNIQFLKAQV